MYPGQASLAACRTRIGESSPGIAKPATSCRKCAFKEQDKPLCTAKLSSRQQLQQHCGAKLCAKHNLRAAPSREHYFCGKSVLCEAQQRERERERRFYML